MKSKAYLIIILYVVLYGCSKTNDSDNEAVAKKSFTEKQATKVKVAKVRQGNFAMELIGNGKLRAKNKAFVPFKVQEQILKVKVKNGQRVKKDQVLALLEPFKYQKQLKDAHRQFEKASFDLEDQLLGYGYQMKDTLKMPANILKMAKVRSGYLQAASNLEEAEYNYQATKVKAPINGIVANMEALAHNPSTQYKKCCEVLNDSLFVVDFQVLEAEMVQLKEGQKVELIPFAMQDHSFEGKVFTINPSVDENGMVTVQAEVNNMRQTLKDGMNVKVIVKNQINNQLIVPKAAVLYRQNRKVVFVHKDGIAQWVYVEIGKENSDEVTIIDQSLIPGQEVIISNNLNLAHESPVEVH